MDYMFLLNNHIVLIAGFLLLTYVLQFYMKFMKTGKFMDTQDVDSALIRSSLLRRRLKK